MNHYTIGKVNNFFAYGNTHYQQKTEIISQANAIHTCVTLPILVLTASHVLWTYTFSVLASSILQMNEHTFVVSPLQNLLVNYCMPTCSPVSSFFPIYRTGDSMRKS